MCRIRSDGPAAKVRARPCVRGGVGTRGAAVKNNGGLFVNGMDRSE